MSSALTREADGLLAQLRAEADTHGIQIVLPDAPGMSQSATVILALRAVAELRPATMSDAQVEVIMSDWERAIEGVGGDRIQATYDQWLMGQYVAVRARLMVARGEIST